jgi:phosphate transport system protein
MASRAAKMIGGSLRAFAERDPGRAREVCLADDEVDELFQKVFQDVVGRVARDELDAERANYLVWAAHNLERTADRTTNICERVIYATTGEFLEARELVGREL